MPEDKEQITYNKIQFPRDHVSFHATALLQTILFQMKTVFNETFNGLLDNPLHRKEFINHLQDVVKQNCMPVISFEATCPEDYLSGPSLNCFSMTMFIGPKDKAVIFPMFVNLGEDWERLLEIEGKKFNAFDVAFVDPDERV